MSHFRNAPAAPGVAFITGGARGIGNAIAVSFAKEGAQAVVIVDIQDEATTREGKEAVEKYGARVLTIHADVTKEDQVEKAVETAVKEFGRIDYAANFAGIVGPLTLAWDTPLEEWRKPVEVNQVGTWLCMKHELRQMIKQDSVEVGSIVNCASVASILGGELSGAYAASKHAVMGITKSAAIEARRHNIRVNAVSPGFLRTRLTRSDSRLPDATWDAYEARQGREASVNEIGDVVALLSTPRMSLVNGHNLVVDGGYTIS
ncbi:hypothetical protein Z517_03568 [Fonsecaea pedrosoi CBS 271.37]|uniref:Uncharacterized protein n=1 Tax=Fonsecaea pedrosoi CBS 271.37 TaxID=1442368 RepID=A0A0D2GTH9_9EURO|nr:uncharacterized protein Z517_03568 [Fonsecaea pedrosoi CBS 271.37]KIW84318.1 hypothetical protein Z517_03568 [Fonsecaea pedrosoi CBS 271.37]